jgi:hypothetical protein
LWLAYEIIELATQYGLDPKAVMSRQTFLLVGSEDSVDALSTQAVKALSGLMPLGNIWLMAQSSFKGLNREPGGDWRFDLESPSRLHNHGHMVMQKAMDRQVYRLDESGRRDYFSRDEFFSRLGDFEDLISNNIEDLDYLKNAFNPTALGLAIRLARSGYGMLMEITRNNKKNPVKGGMCAFDRALGHDVVIESFCLRNVAPKDIEYLNKNMNHYLNPAKAMAAVMENGLGMPVVVHDNRVYFQPVQGDINFLTRTAFFTNGQDTELNSLKYPSDISAALSAMAYQDSQPKFASLCEQALGL